MAIELRVYDKESERRKNVAEELAEHLKAKWGVVATIREAVPESGSAEDAGRVRSLVELAVLVLHIAITAYSSYETFVRQPRESAVAKWRELVFFAKEKRPTLIRAIIGNQDVHLDQADPERLYEWTRKTLDSAIISTE